MYQHRVRHAVTLAAELDARVVPEEEWEQWFKARRYVFRACESAWFNLFFGVLIVFMVFHSSPGAVCGRQQGQTSEGSFSALSTPIFASKYSLELAICSKRRLGKGTWGETEK